MFVDKVVGETLRGMFYAAKLQISLPVPKVVDQLTRGPGVTEVPST